VPLLYPVIVAEASLDYIDSLPNKSLLFLDIWIDLAAG
jgi:hypothetical protein